MESVNPAFQARALLERLRPWQRQRGVKPTDLVDLRQLLSMLELQCEPRPELFDRAGGPVIGELDRAKGIVRVSEQYGARATRFTVAHEIGHYVLHRGLLHHRDPPGAVLGGTVGHLPCETEANDLAAELLMPEGTFKAAFYARFEQALILSELSDDQAYTLGILGNQHRVSTAEIAQRGLPFLAELAAGCASLEKSGHASLADEFQVSKAAVSTRLRSLGLVRLGAPTRRALRSPAQYDTQDEGSPSILSSASIAASATAAGQQPALVTASIDADRRTEPPMKAVALLGGYPQQWKNRRLLKERGWAVLDDDSPEALETLRINPPCGVVVHRSFWKRLPPGSREEAIRRLGELSSSTVVHLDSGGMNEGDVRLLETTPLTLLRNGVGSYRQTPDGELEDADFLALDRVLQLKQRATRILLQTDGPLDGLATSLFKLIAAEQFATGSPLVTVERLHSGHSGGRNFVVFRDDEEATFAKIDHARALASELQRTRTCEPYVSSLVVPELRFHGSLGALLQPFISAQGISTLPAQSLEHFLRDLHGSPSKVSLFTDSILPNVLGILTKLGCARVNEAARDLSCVLHPYQSDRKRGRDWLVSGLASECIDELARVALGMLAGCDQVAMAHGDFHLRNILLKDGRNPVIIDFAQAGPRHPLFDLVRFEIAIWTVLLRDAEDDVVQEVVGGLVAHEAIDPELIRRFQRSGVAVHVTVQSSMLIRDSCRTVMASDKNWFAQYRAMHVLLGLLAFQFPANHRFSLAVFTAVATLARALVG